MNISIARALLLDALSVASAPVDSDPTQPILASVKLTLGGFDLQIVGTDLTTTAVASVPADGKEGACCANARTIIERVKLLPDGVVRLRLEPAANGARGGTLHIEGGSRRFAMAVRDADEFPAAAEIDKPANGNAVPVAMIAALLDRGGTSMSDDKSAQIVQRVVAITTKEGWTEVGSACRHSSASAGIETGISDHAEVLVPARGIEILRRFFGGKGDARVSVIDRRIVASRERSSVAVTLADSTAALYRIFGTLPMKAETAVTITVNRAVLLDAVSAVASASEMHRVELHGTPGEAGAPGKLRIVGRSDQGEPAEDEIACVIDGSVESIVSGDLLTKMLRLAGTETVTIRIPPITTAYPMMIREVGELDAQAWWIVMPIMPNAYHSRPAASDGAASAKAPKEPKAPKAEKTDGEKKERKPRKKKESMGDATDDQEIES
jgi:DNA polymerase III sliding clamp (beta) subunit (PCNA family)